MLQHKLSQELPDVVPGLHRMAATWFEANGEPIEGIRHAIRAQDWDELTRMLTASFHLVLSNDGPDLVAALDPVAARADGAVRADADPPLCALLAAALCHYYRRDYQATRRDVRRAVELLPTAAADIRPAAAVLLAVERSAYGRSVDVATVAQASTELLALVDRTDPRYLPAAAYYRVVGTNNLAAGQLWAGEFARAEASLTAALAQARHSASGWPDSVPRCTWPCWTCCTAGFVAAAGGRPMRSARWIAAVGARRSRHQRDTSPWRWPIWLVISSIGPPRRSTGAWRRANAGPMRVAVSPWGSPPSSSRQPGATRRRSRRPHCS